jgi:hypothetical protein
MGAVQMVEHADEIDEKASELMKEVLAIFLHPTPCSALWIEGSCGQGNVPSFGCPGRHSPTCSRSNVAAVIADNVVNIGRAIEKRATT